MTNLFKALEASFQGDVTADASALVSVSALRPSFL